MTEERLIGLTMMSVHHAECLTLQTETVVWRFVVCFSILFCLMSQKIRWFILYMWKCSVHVCIIKRCNICLGKSTIHLKSSWGYAPGPFREGDTFPTPFPFNPPPPPPPNINCTSAPEQWRGDQGGPGRPGPSCAIQKQGAPLDREGAINASYCAIGLAL